MPSMYPKGLLLDFGGVIVETSPAAGWVDTITDHIDSLLLDEVLADFHPGRERIAEDLVAGDTCAKLWRNAMARPSAPRELTHEEFLLEFVAADWPEPAKEALAPHASTIAYQVCDKQVIRRLRNGIGDLLRWCADVHLPVAIVSNALNGQVHRDFLSEAGLSGYVLAEVYSDEAGVRKPNPELIVQGARRLNIPVADCWYVGDHLDRDVLCGVRAGVGATVLMPAPNTPKRPFTPPVVEDIRVADPAHLLVELKNSALASLLM